MNDKAIQKYLPLTETTYFTLLALSEPLHGYGVMQKVETLSEGKVSIGPGTMYGAFTNLEKAGLIRAAGQEERRKYYALTPLGKRVLAEQITRLEMMARIGLEVLPNLT